MREDPDDRYAAVTERRSCGPLNPLDAAQIAVSDDVDRTCGYAVRVLSGAQGTPRGMRVLLDVLGMLDRDRVCGMYYALPPEKRRVAHSDYVWAYYVREVKRDMPGALAQVEELVALSGREGWADGRGRDKFAYLLGLSNDLSIEEVAALEIRRFSRCSEGARTRRARHG